MASYLKRPDTLVKAARVPEAKGLLQPMIDLASRSRCPIEVMTDNPIRGDVGGQYFVSGDWIIEDLYCVLSPCKDDVFRRDYEPVDDETVRKMAKAEINA